MLGIGYFPVAPGTAASFATLFILFIPGEYRWLFTMLAILFSFTLGLKYISYAESIFGDDNKKIVIDEFLGMAIVLSNPFIDYDWLWITLSLLLFRVYDVLKIYPANRLNDRSGAAFVLLDDVAAGIICMFLLQIFHWIYQLTIIFILSKM